MSLIYLFSSWVGLGSRNNLVKLLVIIVGGFHLKFLPQFQVWSSWSDCVHWFTNLVNLSLVYTKQISDYKLYLPRLIKLFYCVV